LSRLATLALATALAALLSACTYDYLQRSDRVAYSAGDAVKANLEAETSDPANPQSDNTNGLGKNGPIEGLTNSYSVEPPTIHD
jgi:hypothetical protein